MLGQRELFKTRLPNKIEVELREPCKQRLAEAGENGVASSLLGLARNGRQRASLRAANESAAEREPGGVNSECDAA